MPLCLHSDEPELLRLCGRPLSQGFKGVEFQLVCLRGCPPDVTKVSTTKIQSQGMIKDDSVPGTDIKAKSKYAQEFKDWSCCKLRFVQFGAKPRCGLPDGSPRQHFHITNLFANPFTNHGLIDSNHWTKYYEVVVGEKGCSEGCKEWHRCNPVSPSTYMNERGGCAACASIRLAGYITQTAPGQWVVPRAKPTLQAPNRTINAKQLVSMINWGHHFASYKH